MKIVPGAGEDPFVKAKPQAATSLVALTRCRKPL